MAVKRIHIRSRKGAKWWESSGGLRKDREGRNGYACKLADAL